MSSFLLSLVALSVIGSINPNGFAVQIYLLSTAKPVIRALTFALGEYVALWIAGLLIAWGMTQVLEQFLNSLSKSIYILHLFVGIALLIVGWNATKLLRFSTKTQHPRSLKSLHTFWLGFSIVAIETPTALPHVAALKHMADAHLSIPTFVLLWTLYDLIFVLPLLIFISVYLVLNDKAVNYLAKFYYRINIWFPKILPLALMGIGLILIINSLIHFYK
jgi:cytochrome c biogenesis protein CcdA